MTQVLVLNGPNLNLLGLREHNIYGNTTLVDLETELRKSIEDDVQLEFFQTNYEGQMIERIHQIFDKPVDGIIINPGAWTHTSIALRDALVAVAVPIVEVHISNIHARESFRHRSYISGVAIGIIVGCGVAGYSFALKTLMSEWTKT